jgi:hypothetical protein
MSGATAYRKIFFPGIVGENGHAIHSQIRTEQTLQQDQPEK